LEVAWYLLLFQARYSTHVRCIRVERSVTIDADQPLPVQADGDLIGQTPVHVRLIPSAVQVIVPE
jgi:diacylglycerol kinase family enzyme